MMVVVVLLLVSSISPFHARIRLDLCDQHQELEWATLNLWDLKTLWEILVRVASTQKFGTTQNPLRALPELWRHCIHEMNMNMKSFSYRNGKGGVGVGLWERKIAAWHRAKGMQLPDTSKQKTKDQPPKRSKSN
jgi:hypothetical protein